jgi:hypothetical protein
MFLIKEETKMEEESNKAVWNFDGAELYLIFQIKNKIVESFESWDLETSYWKLRLLRMELDAKLQRTSNKMLEEFDEKQDEIKGKKKPNTEKQIVDDMIKVIDNKYSEYKKLNEPEQDDKSVFYQELETFYMHLCHLMKKHGLYFREGEDMRLAVLRR